MARSPGPEDRHEWERFAADLPHRQELAKVKGLWEAVRKLGFTTPDLRADKDVTNHTGNIRYGNEPFMLWGACPGMADPQWIAESVEWMVRPDAVHLPHEHTPAHPDAPRPEHRHHERPAA